jgi:PncC family amidohydrolase
MIYDLLAPKGLTISSAESLTGGLVSAALTATPGSSEIFLAGITAYSIESKINILEVSADTIKKKGAVSSACAIEMALGIWRLTGSDLAVATTGLAGPSGGTAKKPIGLTYVAFFQKKNHSCIIKRLKLSGDRALITAQAAEEVLDLVACTLKTF